ncbi:MAG: SPOR domain-containing protein, partial [Gemmatimonadota bacterium]
IAAAAAAAAADSAARAGAPVTSPTTAAPAATPPGGGALPATPPTAPAAAAPVSTAVTPAAPAAAYYSVQLAAYDSHDAAVRLVQQLVSIGTDARVDGAKPPYRVRVGKYQTRAEAVKSSADLKGKGHSGFITLVSPSPQ